MAALAGTRKKPLGSAAVAFPGRGKRVRDMQTENEQ
jgi:hypothetical protein